VVADNYFGLGCAVPRHWLGWVRLRSAEIYTRVGFDCPVLILLRGISHPATANGVAITKGSAGIKSPNPKSLSNH